MSPAQREGTQRENGAESGVGQGCPGSAEQLGANAERVHLGKRAGGGKKEETGALSFSRTLVLFPLYKPPWK